MLMCGRYLRQRFDSAISTRRHFQMGIKLGEGGGLLLEFVLVGRPHNLNNTINAFQLMLGWVQAGQVLSFQSSLS